MREVRARMKVAASIISYQADEGTYYSCVREERKFQKRVETWTCAHKKSRKRQTRVETWTYAHDKSRKRQTRVETWSCEHKKSHSEYIHKIGIHVIICA